MWAVTGSEATAPRTLSGGHIFSTDVDPVDDVSFDGLTATQPCQLVPPRRGMVVAARRRGDHHDLRRAPRAGHRS
ncbi:hypothetical protein [Saccharopolyspora pogona]|uniref:hypothetical protein n=1 Tax=Saccharopolyspora pogona TaxID=333966 RepID=UPI0037CCB600